MASLQVQHFKFFPKSSGDTGAFSIYAVKTSTPSTVPQSHPDRVCSNLSWDKWASLIWFVVSDLY